MKFTKLSKGIYSFKGIDTWTNNEIEGVIEYQLCDVKSDEVWQVIFGLDTKCASRPFKAKTLKECKNWLTY
tara:strand:+ start:256 stop:468 length:213 start_codon:yes stop_codon:yes gene_type:complete